MPPRPPIPSTNPLQTSLSRCNLLNPPKTPPTTRPFSSTPPQQTRLRRAMFQWLATDGQKFYDSMPGRVHYLGSYTSKGLEKPNSQSSPEPFAQNEHFRSEPVTSEEVRVAVWESVMKHGKSVKQVSAEMGIEMRRVAAIVRLQEVEKEWTRKGKRLARPYAKAVMSMLPQTDLRSLRQRPHESVNDLPVHGATQQQIFWPTSESREFTRVDAAKVFDDTLLPADERIPHPEMVVARGPDAEARQKKRAEEEQRRLLAYEQRKEREEKATKVVQGARWAFKFQDVSVDDAGVDGRGPRGTGWRYGVPFMDRKRGQIKIPTKVL